MAKLFFDSSLPGAKILSGLQGDLPVTQELVAQIVYASPIISFEVSNSINIDGSIQPVVVEFHFKVFPRNIKPHHNNRIQAVRDRINAALRTIEKFALAQAGDSGRREVTAADLPNTQLLSALYDELDDAMDERLISAITDPDTHAAVWDYVDGNGHTPMLTKELLRADLRLGERMQLAFQEWLNPTKARSGATTETTKDAGTSASTRATQEVYSSVSPSPSTPPEPTSLPNQDAPTSPGSTSPLNSTSNTEPASA